VFEALGVEPRHLIALSDSLFDDMVDVDPSSTDGGKPVGKELDFNKFLETVIHMRPRNTASVLDISDLRKAIRKGNHKLEQALEEVQQLIVDDIQGGCLPVASPGMSAAAFEQMLEAKLAPLKAEVDKTKQRLDEISGTTK